MTRSIPLPGPMSPHVKMRGGPAPVRYDTPGWDRCPMGDGGHLGGVHIEALAQADAGCIRHDHDPAGQRRDLVQHRPLMPGRVRQDRVRDHDGGHVEAAEDLEYLVTVGTSVEPVLMLHNCHIALIQQIRTGDHRARRSVHQLADDQVAPRRWPAGVHDPHDADMGVVRGQSGRQRGGEGSQTACSRGKELSIPKERSRRSRPSMG